MLRCCPSQKYDKRSWRPHSVFLVPGIIPLIFVFLLGWTDIDVFHVNWTCWTVTSMDPFIIWKIVPFFHCIVTLTTTPHLVITVILTSMHNLQPVCIDIFVLWTHNEGRDSLYNTGKSLHANMAGCPRRFVV